MVTHTNEQPVLPVQYSSVGGNTVECAKASINWSRNGGDALVGRHGHNSSLLGNLQGNYEEVVVGGGCSE